MMWGFGSRPTRASVVHHVLCERYLFTYITSFQNGFAWDLVELVHANDTSFRARGWLPALVVAKGDLSLLQRLYRHLQDQVSVYGDQSFASFGCVWLDALQVGKLDMADWIETHPAISSNHDATVTLRFALSSGHIKVVDWVLHRVPSLKTQLTSEAMEACPTVELFQWLETNVPTLPCLGPLLDRAADQNQLDLVQYVLSTHRTACTSNRAIVNAAAKGHLPIVEFLHEHAHDHCSSNAMRAAAWYGHLDVVQYLNEHCSTAHGDAFELAALAGHLLIVQYLVCSRTDVRVMRAHALVQQSGQHPHVLLYLSAILNPVHCSARYYPRPTRFCSLL